MSKYAVSTALLIAAGLLGGCATPASLVLKDGSELQAMDTPAFDEETGFYEFEQIDGKRIRVNRDEVITIQDLQ